MKRILINATQQEELRVAMVDGQKLYNLDIEYASGSHKKNNIYKGKITRVEPSLDSIFVDFGSEKNGFLPFREISREYYLTEPIPGEKHNINNLLEEGQEIVVQVVKEERGTKGAALTTYLSLAGRFMVFKPNNPKGGGISRKITGRERLDTFELLDQLDQPDGSSIIVRTAGVGRSLIELQWDLNYLAGIWDSIKKLAVDTKPPALIFKENSLIARSMRDHLEDDVGEIIIDDEETYENSKKYSINNLDLLMIDAEGYDGDIAIDFLSNSSLRPIIVFEYLHIRNIVFEKLIDKLVSHNKPFTMMTYPRGTHSIREGKNTTLHLYTLMTSFLKKSLEPTGPDN